MTEERKTVAVDFDGVIHDWDGEWRGHGVCAGEPIKDPVTGVTSVQWLHELLQEYNVVVLTTRGATFRGRMGVRMWMRKHADLAWDDVWDGDVMMKGMRHIRVTDRKPRALMYIDDRGWRYEGNYFPSANRIRGMRPWWKERVE